ncbi:MAG: hypothetical protein LBQ15_10410 [Clostridium sp.]|jgi:hypothetical protein|nr:hypothetical protein [Clostridium sp.]
MKWQFFNYYFFIGGQSACGKEFWLFGEVMTGSGQGVYGGGFRGCFTAAAGHRIMLLLCLAVFYNFFIILGLT